MCLCHARHGKRGNVRQAVAHLCVRLSKAQAHRWALRSDPKHLNAALLRRHAQCVYIVRRQLRPPNNSDVPGCPKLFNSRVTHDDASTRWFRSCGCELNDG